MKERRLIVGALLLVILLAAGCSAVPMSYSQWKSEQDERAKFTAAGIPDKSSSELRQEAAAMRRAAQDVTFAPGR